MENEADFREDVRRVCKIYHQAQELHESDVHVVSVDEKTGIQALERIHPHATEVIEQQCKEAGMNGFLAKPFDLQELYSVIYRAVYEKL